MLHRDLRPGRNRSRVSPQGFTLAELLIVIAIIGVLISILLPTLGSARRAANSAKCLAALRDVGLAFQQYAQENKRAFPVVEWSPPAAFITPAPPAGVARRPWQDYLVKYIHKKDPNGDIGQFRNASTLWGCPSYETDTFYQAATDPGLTAVWVGANKFNSGYGMHRYAIAPYGVAGGPVQIPAPASMTNPSNVAIVRDTGVYGQFYKMEKWGVRAAERALIADSNNYDIVASSTWVKGAAVGPGATEKRCDPFMVTNGVTGNSYITVDGGRHVAPGSAQKKVFASKGVNMLFVDGHAAGVSPEEAWIAVRGGGVDIRQ